jgi:hypothetical protein
VRDAASRSATASSGRFTIRARPGTSLAYGWSHADIGDVGAAGSATHDGFVYEGEALTVTGSGADIWGTADEFHYVWKDFAGNFEINTRVDSVQNVNAWTKAGIMVRLNATTSARHSSIFVTPGKGIVFQRRTGAGPSVSTAGPALTAPVWLRMVRVGNLLRAYYRKVSTDTWTLLGQQEMHDLPSTVNVGVAVTSHADGTRATARFQGIYLASLPAFMGTAIGGATGSWTSDGTNYTVKGSGRDIWGTSDSFFFLAMPLGANNSITARVRTIGNTDPWAKAGVMIRESLAANSKHADAIVSPSKGFAMQYRSTTGGATVSAVQNAGGAPIWLRIRRYENASSPTNPDIFEASYSTDRLIWRQIASALFNTTQDGYIGIAVTSHKEATQTTVVIDDVRVER